MKLNLLLLLLFPVLFSCNRAAKPVIDLEAGLQFTPTQFSGGPVWLEPGRHLNMERNGKSGFTSYKVIDYYDNDSSISFVYPKHSQRGIALTGGTIYFSHSDSINIGLGDPDDKGHNYIDIKDSADMDFTVPSKGNVLPLRYLKIIHPQVVGKLRDTIPPKSWDSAGFKQPPPVRILIYTIDTCLDKPYWHYCTVWKQGGNLATDSSMRREFWLSPCYRFMESNRVPVMIPGPVVRVRGRNKVR